MVSCLSDKDATSRLIDMGGYCYASCRRSARGLQLLPAVNANRHLSWITTLRIMVGGLSKDAAVKMLLHLYAEHMHNNYLLRTHAPSGQFTREL